MVKFARKKRVTPSRRRRAFKRRSFRASNSRMAVGRTVGRSLGPQTVFRRLRYTQLLVLDPGAAGTAVNYYRANGCFDPDFSLGGHQPLGFDQYMALYGTFTVLGSKVTARFCSIGNAVTDPVICGIYVDNDSTPPASGQFEQLLEQPNNKWKYCGALNQATNGHTVTQRWSAKRWWHRSTRALMNDPQYSGSSTADPTKVVYYNVYCFPSDATSNPVALDVWVTIEFFVAFSTLNTLAQS